jgi:RNA polymerase sigma-70 factor (ECF subfamily)
MDKARTATFPPTRWSLVCSVRGKAPEAALAELLALYWDPLYRYVRRTGKSEQDAEDLTQSFVAKLVESGLIGRAEEERGKLRTFLLVALKRFLASEHRHETAQKRGGGAAHATVGSALDEHEPAHEETPDREYDRRWALTLLENVLASLEEEYTRVGKGELFAELRGAVADGETARSYPEIGETFGMSLAAVKMSVYRLRQRYRELLRERVADTLEFPEGTDDEIAYLIGLFG